jgi:Uma2 family endonuclease
MAIQAGLLTYEDYVALPDDGQRQQLFEGVLEVSPSPGLRHQIVVGRLYLPLATGVSEGMILLGPIDVIFDPRTVLVPDLVWLAPDRLHLASHRGIEGPPTLAIEVVSPGSGRIDRVRKLETYAKFGVRYYWIVDPLARTIEVYELDGADFRLTTVAREFDIVALPPFLGLTLDLAAIFAL